MLYRIKQYLQSGAVLAALVLAGLAGVAYLYVSASSSLDEAAGLDDQRLSTLARLEAQKSETAAAERGLAERQKELDRKREQLEADRQAASIANLTTSQDAEILGSLIINYAVENDIEIIDFQTADTVTSITDQETLTFIDKGAPNVRRISETCVRTETGEPAGEFQVPTVTYTFKTRGGRYAQTGLIQLAEDMRTTRIETLEIIREDGSSDVWTLKVCIHVPYGEE